MKTIPQITAEQAALKVKDGDKIFRTGFGMTGNQVHLLHALAKTQIKNLTYIKNNVGKYIGNLLPGFPNAFPFIVMF